MIWRIGCINHILICCCSYELYGQHSNSETMLIALDTSSTECVQEEVFQPLSVLQPLSFISVKLIWARCYKNFFMLNSAEHEILNAQKYKIIKKLSIF